jgi:hypothetical protein
LSRTPWGRFHCKRAHVIDCHMPHGVRVTNRYDMESAAEVPAGNAHGSHVVVRGQCWQCTCGSFRHLSIHVVGRAENCINCPFTGIGMGSMLYRSLGFNKRQVKPRASIAVNNCTFAKLIMVRPPGPVTACLRSITNVSYLVQGFFGRFVFWGYFEGFDRTRELLPP